MSQQPQILIHNLSYNLPTGKPLFKDFSFCFDFKKTAIVGKNGSGKSSLVKLIQGEVLPQSGSIQSFARITICPQDFSALLNKTIAAIFGITEKLAALKNINAGSINEHDFAVLNDDWLVKEKTLAKLAAFGLQSVPLEKPLKDFSGGEITRIFLANAFAANPDFIILDEPTNNLDCRARNILYDKIIEWQQGLIVISHDRKILELMEQIIDITPLGVKIYAGNFSDYCVQKDLEQKAKMRELEDARKLMQKTAVSVQTSREKREQREAKGKHLRKSGGQPKMLLDAMRDSATHNQKKLLIKARAMQTRAEEQLQTAKNNIIIEKQLVLELPKTKVPHGNLVLKIENLSFAYQNSAMLFNGFNLTLVGPERIAISGPNGSGKTTLVRLILNELQPTNGTVYCGVKTAYLDQLASTLNSNISVMDNFKLINLSSKETEARTHLARFLFRADDALKLAGSLSGGEKLRALLACILMSDEPPQLIILDEPTNHLDLDSVAIIEHALQLYQGALIVISHDERFLINIGVSKRIVCD